MAKKTSKKKGKKTRSKPVTKSRRTSRPIEHRVVVSVRQDALVPTVSDLSEPMRAGKKLVVQKTWLSEHQLLLMLQATPKTQVYRRKGKGGQWFDYVTGGYATKWLNFVFGWNWDFEIVEHGKEQDHVWALGKLTVYSSDGSKKISKTQFGRSEVKYLTKEVGGKRVRSDSYVDYGNDLKAAATDSLKKCASLLGFASDIYSKSDYKAETGAEPREGTVQPTAKATPEKDFAPRDYVCSRRHCGTEISKQVYDYSMKLYGKPLCREHQEEANAIQ